MRRVYLAMFYVSVFLSSPKCDIGQNYSAMTRTGSALAWSCQNMKRMVQYSGTGQFKTITKHIVHSINTRTIHI